MEPEIRAYTPFASFDYHRESKGDGVFLDTVF
jgi:hypothetical protein